MATPQARRGIIRFDVYEADLHSGELLKAGVKVKLEGQPFQVLAVLLTHPTQLVTREELKKELWPDETFVDFEQGINAAVKRLRLALDDSAETPRFIETLPRRGYRFIGRVENGLSSGAEVNTVAPSHAEPPSAPATGLLSRWRRVHIWVAALATSLLIVLGLNPGGLRDRLLGEATPGEITSVAVLPLANLTGDPAQEYFADGMTESLINELGRISALRVISRTSAMAFKNAKRPLPDIARELGVQAVLEGAVTREGDQIRITVRLVHAGKERTLWSGSYQRDLSEVSKVQNQIVLVVADEIKVKLLSHEQAYLAQLRPVNPRAYDAYLMGRYLQARRNPDDMRKAYTYFKHSLEIDPTYAPAYIGIVDCYGIGGGRQMGVSVQEADAKMKEAARKAVEVDSSTAAAHYALGMIKWHEWDFPAAEKEFRRALELNPGDVQVRQQYSHYLLSMRRFSDARRELQHALALDPLSAMLTVDLGFPGFFSGKFEETVKQCRKALEMQKDFIYARNLLGSAYWRQGRVQDAFNVGWPAPYMPERSRHAREVYARAGSGAMIQWLIKDAEARHSTGEFYSRSSEIAKWYLHSGDKEKALIWFEEAYKERDPWLPMDLASTLVDPLRSDSRFQDLQRRIGLHTQ